jgi:hypothetical protein
LQRPECESGHPERKRSGRGQDHPLLRGSGRHGDSGEREGDHREERGERPPLGWSSHFDDDVIPPAVGNLEIGDLAERQRRILSRWLDSGA